MRTPIRTYLQKELFKLYYDLKFYECAKRSNEIFDTCKYPLELLKSLSDFKKKSTEIKEE